MNIKIGLAVLAAVLTYLAATALVTVEETELVVVSQFGRPTRVIHKAGLAFKLPDPVQTASTLDKRVQTLSLDPAEYVTLERRNLVINAFVLWRIVEPQRFLASVRNAATAELRLASLANSEIGAALGSRPLTDIFSVTESGQQMAEIFAQVTHAANTVAQREFGIEVVTVRPHRFGFPKQNLLAIYKRMEAERDRIARQFRAEGEEEAARIRAETEREVRELRAQAEREAQQLRGESEAQAARIYADAFEANPEYYQFVRSLKAYESVLTDKTRLILSADSPLFERLLNPPAGAPGQARGTGTTRAAP